MVIRKLYVPPTVVKNGLPRLDVQRPVFQEEPAAVAFSTIVEESAAAEDSTENDDVILQIKPGKIVGCKEVLPNGGSLYRFSGIPYAKPPVGELRFKPPVPLERFDVDMLDCKRERSICFSIQYIPPDAGESASEDCLFLNVYTPTLREDESAGGLPVMVWLHGGGFNMGSGDASLYCPNYLVQEGVVVVTCNYRLGPLGFMFLPSMGIYGNMGLKDQRLVLKWVQENIQAFGGNSNNVTLFGESAGGALVHLNYISESSRQYFHKAICMSGVSYNPWVLQGDAEGKARRLAVLLGAETTNDDVVYETLLKAPAKDLISRSPAVMTDDEKRTDMFYPFTPVVEPSNAVEPFLTENFISLMMNPNMTNIPIISGVTSSEGLLISAQLMSGIEEYAANPTKLVPLDLHLPREELTEAAGEIKRFFFGDADIATDGLQTLVDIVSDNMFIMAAYVASELHARYQHEAPQYFYVVSFEDELNKFRTLFQAPDNLSGVCHADELLYLFSSSLMGTEVEVGSRADQFRSTMCKLWTNFAKCGNPTPEGGGLDFVWELVKPVNDSEFTLVAADLNEECKMVENPFMERVQFWRELYARYVGSHLVRRADN
ncbi:carboxylic ester hydrolase-like isoform X2 [Topomyia yanbarensis]|uniref:carboxylic ester hydrolase-like isoform X2 n=1 Tax=Topomyia yanbarensis TaxID=2498891 RepID=UPI00273B471D|nr:carboxylic ester hydrolase-like isoform X2 [Topomyia yanbarensis]